MTSRHPGALPTPPGELAQGRPVVAQRDRAEDVPERPEVSAALEALARDLPDLPLGDHHDRYVAVLDLLHTVLDEARAR